MNRAPHWWSFSKARRPLVRAPDRVTAGEDLAYAFEFISLLRIRHQHEQIALGQEPDNFIDPRRLGSLEQRHLKKICRLIAQLLQEIVGRYGAGSRL